MGSSDAYLATVRDRLVEDGCEVTEEVVGSLHAMVGYRFNVKALSKMHLFTVVASVPEVNEATVRDFSRQASDYAKGQKGRLRGAQSGVLALAALVTPKADDAAKRSIHHDDPQHRDGPCLARPAHDRPRRQPNR